MVRHALKAFLVLFAPVAISVAASSQAYAQTPLKIEGGSYSCTIYSSFLSCKQTNKVTNYHTSLATPPFNVLLFLSRKCSAGSLSGFTLAKSPTAVLPPYSYSMIRGSGRSRIPARGQYCAWAVAASGRSILHSVTYPRRINVRSSGARSAMRFEGSF